MNPITSQTAQDSFLSSPTATSIRSDPVLQLGKKIVQELGLEQSVDTLARWMAHYIAELIQSAETASVEDRPDKMARCAEAILELWAYRNAFPNGKRPFENMEPILRALESLAPDSDKPRYFRSLLSATHEEQEPESKQWLELANGLDYSARILIRYCLGNAAEKSMDKTKEWVSLAEALGQEHEIEVSVVRFIANSQALLNSDTNEDSERAEIEKILQRLDGFIQLAGALSSDLHARLDKSLQ